jgi:hypothetical protein
MIWAKIIFRLDSICPTGAGKVQGVKIEIDEEKWAGGVEVPRRCKMQSGECRPAINGISREKAPKARKKRTLVAARGRDEFGRRGTAALPTDVRRDFVGKSHGLWNDWQRNGRKATKSPRIGVKEYPARFRLEVLALGGQVSGMVF